MREPGYKKIRLTPSLLGLQDASVEIPTPNGMITIGMKRGSAPVICVPDGITVE